VDDEQLLNKVRERTLYTLALNSYS